MSGAVYNVQEAWTMPFAFCTREKHPWTQFAESAETGKVEVQDTAVQLYCSIWHCSTVVLLYKALQYSYTAVYGTLVQFYCCTGHCSTVVLLYMKL